MCGRPFVSLGRNRALDVITGNDDSASLTVGRSVLMESSCSYGRGLEVITGLHPCK